MKGKWAKIVGLTLSFPSLIFSSFFTSHYLVKNHQIPKIYAFGLSFGITLSVLVTLVYYAFSDRKK